MDKKAFKTATLSVLAMAAGLVIVGFICWLADLLMQSGRAVAGVSLVVVFCLALFWTVIYYCEKD